MGSGVLRARAPRDHRRDVRGRRASTSRSKTAPASVGSAVQYASAASQSAPARRERPAREIGEGRLVGRHHARARARPRSTCCRRSCALPSTSRAIAEPAYSMAWPDAAAGADLRDDREDHVLGGDAGAESPSTVTRMRLAACAARGVWVASTCSTSRRADAERQRAERPVGGGVASRRTPAACPGCVSPCSGPDHVHDAAAARRPVRNARCPARPRVARSASTIPRISASATPAPPGAVGHVVVGRRDERSGRRTRRPARARRGRRWPSPRGADADRCRAASDRRALRPRRDAPRSSRTS